MTGGGFSFADNVRMSEIESDPSTLLLVDGSSYLSGISCPTTSLCVGVDEWGKAVTGVRRRAHHDAGE